jgi:hypothetical protein
LYRWDTGGVACILQHHCIYKKIETSWLFIFLNIVYYKADISPKEIANFILNDSIKLLAF